MTVCFTLLCNYLNDRQAVTTDNVFCADFFTFPDCVVSRSFYLIIREVDFPGAVARPFYCLYHLNMPENEASIDWTIPAYVLRPRPIISVEMFCLSSCGGGFFRSFGTAKSLFSVHCRC